MQGLFEDCQMTHWPYAGWIHSNPDVETSVKQLEPVPSQIVS